MDGVLSICQAYKQTWLTYRFHIVTNNVSCSREKLESQNFMIMISNVYNNNFGSDDVPKCEVEMCFPFVMIFLVTRCKFLGSYRREFRPADNRGLPCVNSRQQGLPHTRGHMHVVDK